MKEIIWWVIAIPFLVYLVVLSLDHPTRWQEQHPPHTGCADLTTNQPCK